MICCIVYIFVQHHDGVEEEDVSGSVPQSWAKFSKNNVEESQGNAALETILKGLFINFERRVNTKIFEYPKPVLELQF